jgi:hypothetical protein
MGCEIPLSISRTSDPDLGRNVTRPPAGGCRLRLEPAETPDPQPETFERSKLNWNEREENPCRLTGMVPAD